MILNLPERGKPEETLARLAPKAEQTIAPMMTEYELYPPLHYNDGRKIETEKLEHLKRCMVEEFGGLTRFLQENEGIWKIGEHTFRDRIVILRVLSSDEVRAKKFFKAEMEVIGINRMFLSSPGRSKRFRFPFSQ